MKIAFAEYPESRDRDITTELEYLPDDAEVVFAVYDENDLEAYYEAMSDVDAVLTGFAPIDKAAIDRMGNCRVISVQATGWDCVDHEYARSKGIATCAVGEYCTQEVADHTIALMLALQRRLPYLQRRVNIDRSWDVLAPLGELGVRRIEGQVIGIVGFGKIGRAVAKRAKSFGMEVLAYDPYIPDSVVADMGGTPVDIETLLAESDVITVHMNMTSENESFFSAKRFSRMLKRPVFLNIARGGMVDEDDLVVALDNGQIRGAGLDVLASESPDLQNCRLIGREDVIVTPHTAFFSNESIEDCERISIENICHYIDGDKDKVFKLVEDPDR
ncbi:MAG: C-terminal binding protein [Clostridiales Family XIII bacterium]|nr:C-terminal binding protein [Clostridiales Family XIII bacterium]